MKLAGYYDVKSNMEPAGVDYCWKRGTLDSVEL